MKTKRFRFTCYFIALIFIFSLVGNITIGATESVSSNYIEVVEYDYNTKQETVRIIDYNQLSTANAMKMKALGMTDTDVLPAYFPQDTVVSSSDEQSASVASENSNLIVIRDATVYPYYCVVGLLLKQDTPNGGEWGIGSGFMLGYNVMATAAHCMYSDEHGNVEECRIYIGRTNVSLDLRYQPSVPFYYPQTWTMSTAYTNNGDMNYDWCVVTTGTDIGSTTGWLGISHSLATYSNIDGLDITSVGYANGFLRASNGQTYNSTPLHVWYNSNMVSGMSGGPAYDVDYIALAINTSGDGVNNAGSRISLALYNIIQEKRLAGEELYG